MLVSLEKLLSELLLSL